MDWKTQAAISAQKSDAVFFYVFGLSVAFLIFITALMVYFVVRYNKKRHPKAEQIEGHVGLEIVWTTVPLLLFLSIFYYGWTNYEYMSQAPRDSMVVKVTARQWNWSFEYPNGKRSKVLFAPLGKPMKMEVRSADMVHGFYIPSFRLKIDAVPSRTNTTWFQAIKVGSYDIECTVICGVDHSLMLSKVIVVPEEEFKAWYFGGEDAPEPGKSFRAGEAHPDLKNLPPGLAVLTAKGCLVCHSVDGKPKVGPTLKSLYGKEEQILVAGIAKTIIVDDAYLRRAITNPMDQVVRGYPPAMPRTPLTEEELNEVVRYIKEPINIQGTPGLAPYTLGPPRHRPAKLGSGLTRSHDLSVAVLPSSRHHPVSTFLELTKLRISGASTLTAAAGYVAFLRGANAGLITTLIGILLLAMGSSALNEVQEHKFDALMPRTANRPIPRGDLSPAKAALIATVLAVSGFLLLLLAHNLTSALLGALAMAWYNGFYTPLKRVSAFAVVPGSLIGALPPAIGWTAAGGSVSDPSALALAFVFFIWQVPHFWLLVGLHAEGYEEAGFPTLVGLFGRPRLSRLTFTWICGTAAACGLLPLFRVLVSRPAEIMLGLGALWLIAGSTPLLRSGQDASLYRRVFMNINLFALVLTAAVILDPFFGR